MPSSPKKTRSGFALWLPAIIAAAVLGWLLWSGGLPSLEDQKPPDAPAEPAPTAAQPPRADSPMSRRTRRAAQAPAPGCEPGAGRVCWGGDVYDLDSCGARGDKLDECGAQLCRDGACDSPDPDGCGGESAFGRCDGDTVKVCHAGRLHTHTCAEAERCVVTAEGPTCRPKGEDPCDWPRGERRCEGEVLVSCVEGELYRTDCASHGAICTLGLPDDQFHCVVEVNEEAPAHLSVATEGAGEDEDEEDCGECGCEDAGVEVCNGEDDDGDEAVDEDGVCDPIDLVVYVVEGPGGASYSEEDIAAEVASLGVIFGEALRFEVVEVFTLGERAWVDVDSADLQAIFKSPVTHPARERFYIPVVFTDTLELGGSPKLGASTLPNGTCGGVRRTLAPQSLLGAVVIAKHHAPTTLAHEIGHFLGLCHAHEEMPEQIQRVVRREESWEPCTGCFLDGDGLCGTPPDPGPAGCTYDQTCAVVCADGSKPDATNIMSYYTHCRSSFTDDQMALMRRTVTQRRLWHACSRGACACEPGAGGCPTGMGCRPATVDGARVWSCREEGGLQPQAECRGLNACRADSLCLKSSQASSNRCARLCHPSTEACACITPEGLSGASVCGEDLGLATPQTPP